MNVMFLTLENYLDFNESSIYMDLINEFRNKGHYVTVISACEKRSQKKEKPGICARDDGGEIRKIYVENVTKMTNFVLKGINLLRLRPAYVKAAKEALENRNYDLILYGSPPITVYRAVKLVKKKQGAFSYLMLKDIWPYDCLFGGALTIKGWKRLAFDYLAYLARKLYDTSDVIGCMSPANIRFLLEHEPYLKNHTVEICPNCITPTEITTTQENKVFLRNKYGIPMDRIVFVYGGSLGIPQGIDFALSAVKATMKIREAFFVFVGGGTERNKIEEFIRENQLENIVLLQPLPKMEYEKLVSVCDVGLVFLHHECMSPNYPSRILNYMQAKLPIVCATDVYTDVGRLAEENGYGRSCESNDVVAFTNIIQRMCCDVEREKMGANAYQFMLDHYTSNIVYNSIVKHLDRREEKT